MANSAMPARFTALKSVSTNASGQRIASPTAEISTLMLKALLSLECLPTMTTEKPEAAAERIASIGPSRSMVLLLRGFEY